MSDHPVCRHEEVGSHCDCRYWLSQYQDYREPVLPVACNKCSMCVTGTFGKSCDYWQAVAQRLDSRFGEGAHLRWWFGEIFPDLDADEILALPEI